MASSQRRGKSGARESEVTKDQGREVVYVRENVRAGEGLGMEGERWNRMT
ncbi:MAG: hypothetical protein GY816_17340 [Cytophagales bacterium]|nr:hypothetical protein [Cytophagales bacterium]